MIDEIGMRVSSALSLPIPGVAATIDLLDGGSSVPFIARYRKEATGGLDEVAVSSIKDTLSRLREMDRRRQTILKSLEERGLLTKELLQKINHAESISALEDIYLPFRPKRRTRAAIARERGLQALSEIILNGTEDPAIEAKRFVNPKLGVNDAMEALAGARDIIAEKMSEDSEVRLRMRSLYEEKGELRTKAASGKAEEAAKYRDYLDWSEPISRMPSHRLLAILRGAKEGLLSVFVDVPQEEAEWIMQEPYLEPDASRQQPSTRTRRNAMPAGSSEQIELAAKDGLKRLIGPSIENESLQSARERAEAVASSVFAKNLRELLIEAPLGEKRVLAVDPGFRTGCKLAVLDGGGRLLDHGAIFPHDQGPAREKAAGIVKEICKRHAVEVIAVGNGTAGRETEAFLRSIGLQKNVSIVMVNESGASIYSASNLAREEFPQLDVTVRGAISIGRRLLDPLAELVKIDPSALGIGQYQHDVDPALLKSRLDEVIESCVDQVGVELNTASKELLGRVSGIGPKLAAAIVKFREENGAFTSRKDLLAVPRLGPKAFEQAAGFLRIRDAENPLDASAVHPESYHIVERMAKDLGVGISDLVKSGELRKKIRLQQYVTKTVGLPTLQDIASELERPGRDPRAAFEAFSFKEGIEKLEDLKPGMKLPGIVTNVTAFGAFVDVGVHQDGLVHISQLHDGFVRSPEDIVRPRQRVIVTVLEVDKERRRISLSMRNNASKESKAGTMRDSMQG